MLCLFILTLIWAGLSYLFSLLSTNLWLLILWIPLGFALTIGLFIFWIYCVVCPIFKRINPDSNFKAKYSIHIMKMIPILCGVKLKVEGKENLTSNHKTLYVSNHKSLIDPFLIYIATGRSLTAAAKADLWKFKVLLPLISAFHVIKINRENDREAVKSILEGIKYIKGGNGMIIFPEGGIKTREVDQMVSIKAGAYKLAVKADADIQPIALIGNKNISKRKFWQRFTKVTVRFLPTIHPEDYKELNTHEIAYKVLDMVNSNYPEEAKYVIEEEE